MARILIVDDNHEMVDMLCLLVRAFGHESVSAFDGAQALEHVARQRPDLILLDLMMPEVDGYQVLSSLRENPQTADIPVIVITASAEPDLQERVNSAGADALMRKPADIPRLERLIAELLAREVPVR